MLLQLNQAAAVDNAKRSIDELLGAHNEWFLTHDGGAPLALNSSEFDFSIDHRRLIFSSWAETGSRSWRGSPWNWSGEKLFVEGSPGVGGEKAVLGFVAGARSTASVAGI